MNRAAPWLAAALGLGAVLALFWPGYLSWDSAYAWWQARHADFDPTQPPVLAVRLQELFGLTETPRVAEGRVSVLLHLLGPNYRPVQVTQDLASFWANTYAEVKKDLKGRYPKHYWPDDPLIAEPTARAKPRR